MTVRRPSGSGSGKPVPLMARSPLLEFTCSCRPSVHTCGCHPWGKAPPSPRGAARVVVLTSVDTLSGCPSLRTTRLRMLLPTVAVKFLHIGWCCLSLARALHYRRPDPSFYSTLTCTYYNVSFVSPQSSWCSQAGRKVQVPSTRP